MVRKVSEVFTDDLDGAKATQTISFSVNGDEYEIDLSDSNADKFFSRIDRYISHGRRVGGRARRASMSAKGRGSASGARGEVRTRVGCRPRHRSQCARQNPRACDE